MALKGPRAHSSAKRRARRRLRPPRNTAALRDKQILPIALKDLQIVDNVEAARARADGDVTGCGPTPAAVAHQRQGVSLIQGWSAATHRGGTPVSQRRDVWCLETDQIQDAYERMQAEPSAGTRSNANAWPGSTPSPPGLGAAQPN